MLTADAAGVFPIAPTPFHDDGRIDLASIDRLVEAYKAAGATGLTVLGIMGEATKLTQAEGLEVAQRFLDRVGGAFPVVVGVSAPGFAPMAELARAAMERGAAAVMIAPPATLRTDDAIVGYYAGAAQSLREATGADVPFVVQDFPLVTGVQMTPAVIRRIVDANPACVMLKHEDWPGLDKITALRRAEAAGGRRISILVGNGGLFLPFEVDRGADGAMTGYAFPEMLTEVTALSRAGRRAEAHDVFDRHLPLLRYEQQLGPMGLAVRKYVLKRRGLLASDAQRRPGATLSAESRADVEFLLSRLGEPALRAAA